MTHQLTLPGIDMRPRCPLCGEPALLGQWSPFLAGKACCRACSEREPFPMESLAFDGQDWNIVPGLPNATYERRIVGEDRLRAATKKREYNAGSRPSPLIRQISIPVCETCGRVHDHWRISDYAGQCQRCEDVATVEGLLRMRGTILQGDDETVLDRLYRTHRGLFDRDVLPDAWFALRAR